MDSLSLPFFIFPVVSPKQWTSWAYLSFSQKCHPLLHQKTRCHSIFHIIIKIIIPRFIGLRNIKQVSFLGLSDYGISNKFHSPIYRITEYQTKFHSPVYRITECQTSFIPRFIGLRNIKQGSFPGLSDYGISNKVHSPVYWITEYQTRFIPRFIGLRNIKQVSFPGLSDYGISNKVHSPVYRITEYQTSVFPRFVGLWKVTQVLLCGAVKGFLLGFPAPLPWSSPNCGRGEVHWV